MTLFDLAPNDQSAYYLNQIFGLVGSILPFESGPLLFPLIFRTLNTLALTVGTLMVVYITIVGVMQTAHEGEFMGKKWSGLWIPIRMVLGIVTLVPTKTGYAAIQIIVMWVIIQGVGAADKLWTTILTFQQVAGSVYQSVDVSTINKSQIQTNMLTLFNALSCQATARKNYPEIPLSTTEGKVKYYCTGVLTNFCQQSENDLLDIVKNNTMTSKYSMGPDGQCGSLSYCDIHTCDEKDILCQTTCNAQKDILQQIVTSFGAQIGNKLAQVDYSYLYFHETPGAKAPDFVSSYCVAKNIPAEKCCSIPPPNIPGFSVTQPDCDPQIRKLSPFYSPDGNNIDKNNSSKEAIQEIYLPYSMNPYVNGSNFIYATSDAYAASLAAAVNEYYESKIKNTTTLSGWQDEAQRLGWIMAGSYYYRMANANKQSIKALYPTFTVTGANFNQQFNYRSNYKTADELAKAFAAKTNPSSKGDYSVNQAKTLPSQFSDVAEGAIGSTSGTLLATFMNNLTNNSCQGGDCTKGGNANPLASIATFGYQLMITAQVLFWTLAVASAALTAALSINPIALGTTYSTLSPWGEAIKAFVNFVGPFVVILISSIYSLGALLGIYVPLIPYIVFTMSAIGWMIGTVEAMVASPLIALGILSPGGQHEILGRAESAVMLLFNLFLRPTLMIVGLMAAMLMSIVVVRMINSGFLAITSQIMQSPGLFEEILFISAYTSLIVTALNKTFSLIHHLPERVTTWIGGTPVSYGEQEALGETKRGIEGAAGAGVGAGKAAGAAAMAGGESVGRAKAGKAEQDKNAAADAQIKAGQAAGSTPAAPTAPAGNTGAGGGSSGGTGAGGGAGAKKS